ncbi:hypothetical protein DBR23_08950 [Acidovorax sp. HMWF018]|uniref:hypothetical protein n=1 Tax=Acidovorax sp. HMWF018 TaxID=2056855 RepID=UPI000D33DB29|nr:hypothetical protein [Acidovorax sp. HMWF018]PTT40219.1 hypothetical protein DBR23_08950 [Acidovorax sp. HMWF018]
MARTQTPAPASKEPVILDAVIAQDMSAANQLALITRETETRVRAIAQQMGYQLPADATDPDLIQRDIAANMRRSVEACLEVGRGLTVLKAACEHGQFMARLDVLGIESRVAQRFMQSAAKFSIASTSTLLKAAGGQSKLFEMLVLDDEQIGELELTGQTGELSLDDVATMSVKELRAAVREARAEKAAVDKVLSDKNTANDKLRAQLKRIATIPPDDALADLQREATAHMNDALGAVRGGLRAALIALNNHGDERGQQAVFMAGLVGQVAAELATLREEFNLPDVSNAADIALAGEVAQWAK